MTRIIAEPVEYIRPGKAQVYLDPRANALLERAIAEYGKPIYPTGSGSAGRTKAQQEYYYDRHLNHGGPVAANPNWGRRPHMRFGAIDIDDENARRAMLAVGWVATTPSEWWHFEHPSLAASGPTYAGWPIVTEFYLPPTTTTPSRRTGMTTRFVQIGTGGSDFGKGALCALAGDAGFPGPANWQEYTRTVADGSVNDRAAQEFKVHGPAIPISKADWPRLKKEYTTPTEGGAGGLTAAETRQIVSEEVGKINLAVSLTGTAK